MNRNTFILIATAAVLCCVFAVSSASFSDGSTDTVIREDGIHYEVIGGPDGSAPGSLSVYDFDQGLSEAPVPDKVRGYDVTSMRINNGSESSVISLDMPDSIRGPEHHSICGCDSLTSIELPAGLRHMDEDSISGYGDLRSVDIPYGLTYLPEDSISDCGSLESISIPASMCMEELDLRSYKDLSELTIDCGCTVSSFRTLGADKWVFRNTGDSVVGRTLISNHYTIQIPNEVMRSSSPEGFSVSVEFMSMDDFPFEVGRYLSHVGDIYRISFEGAECMSGEMTVDLSFGSYDLPAVGEPKKVTDKSLEPYPSELMDGSFSRTYRMSIPPEDIVFCCAAEAGKGFAYYPEVSMAIIVLGTLGGAVYFARHRRP